MRPTDIAPLIRITMMLIGLALATGQFHNLRDFVRREAVRSARGWHTPAFFPSERRWYVNPQMLVRAGVGR